MLIFGVVLLMGVAVDASRGTDGVGNILYRNELGQSKYKEELTLKIEGIEEEVEYILEVEAMRPTKAEAEEYFALAETEIDEDFFSVEEHVIKRVSYAKGLVSGSWKFSPWDVVRADGTIDYDNVPEGGVVVQATVLLSCGEYERSYQFAFEVQHREKSEEELLVNALDDWMKEQLQKEGEAEVMLPTQLLGKQLSWSRKKESLTLQLAMLELLAMAILWILGKQSKEKKHKKRVEGLQQDYPELVAQLALLTSAGMNIQLAWNTIAARYSDKRQKNLMVQKEAYEGLVRMSRAIQEGENEKIAYQRYANEMNHPLYHRLIRLLIGKLEKGSKGLQEVLTQESRQAYEQRILYAKKKGEEASTRMLIPLMLMMVVVMAIVMAPAMLEFTK